MNGMGLILKRDGHELRSNSDDPLLRDGDEVVVEMAPPPPMPVPVPVPGRQSRPRIVPPPAPSSN
jgi:hypothetical protein